MSHPLQNAVANQNLGGQLGAAISSPLMVNVGPNTGTVSNAIWGKTKVTSSKTIFSARIEVVQVANGYMVQIGRQEGYEYESYIASSIKEVNDILGAQMVAMKLEGQ